MSVNICIDWGNTNVKAAIFADNKIVEQSIFVPSDALKITTLAIDKYAPNKAIICSVNNDASNLETFIIARIKSSICLNNKTRLPIMNAYSSPDTLGVDRIAMVTAANDMFPDKNNLVICIGTCITYNLMQKNRTFRGGAISPGLKMRLKAMHEFTGRLPIVDVEGDLLLLGYDTETCMRGGAVLGIIAEIDGLINEFENQYTDFNVILTGGDAPYFATKIKSRIFADPDLILKGLNLIVNYNVPFPR